MGEENTETVGVLFVCLGNICRSPLAEWTFRKHVSEAGLDHAFNVKSVGTGGWHIGQSADERMLGTAARYGVSLDAHCARQIRPSDLDTFDYVVVMDRRNLADVQSLDPRGTHRSKLHLLREFDPEPGAGEVPDPYYGGQQGFDEVFRIVDRSTRALLDHLITEFNLPAGERSEARGA